ncbi:MAG: TIGR02302 family protein [Rhodospirillales bacterium CG15_BIG_FIL_POST_REV_8_21_14_020_66_15]|nr:MAG: TIGR02302 family protein [Rhodospirillales bacterium CG15_BIG_FIL_POST_REV_8_21_14_020_66_15]
MVDAPMSATGRPDTGLGLRYRLLLSLARAVVYLERMWPLAAPVLAVALLFVAVALLDVLPLLPHWLHGLVLIAFAGVLALTLRRAWEKLPRVSRATARHRLENDSGFVHRPLAALDDRLLVGMDDRLARRLWRRHRERMAQRVAGLRVGAPSPDVARHDPGALRAPLLLILVLAIAAGWGDAGDRLMRAVTPLGAAGLGKELHVSIWITPPAYTRQAPIFLELGGGKTVARATGEAPQSAGKTAGNSPPPVSAILSVPQGSTLLAQVSGVSRTPEIVLGGIETPFTPIGSGNDAGSFRLETLLDSPGAQDLAVTVAGRGLANWPLVVVADAPPTAEFIAKPSRSGRASLKTDFEAKDDYGLASVQLTIRHPKGRPVPGGEEIVRLALPLAEPGTVLTQGVGVHDLSAHPWAGIEVVGRIEATDGRGQVGVSDDLKFLLPQRTFNHPVARALVEQRRRLSDASPEVITEVVEVLNDILHKPDHFFNDTVVFLAIDVAGARLLHSGGKDREVASVQKLLWDTALRIEDGDFAVAERELMDLQGKVMQAMRQGADTEEVQRLMEQLRQALDEYLKALTEQLARQELKDLPAFDPNMQPLESRDLQDMIDRARELARNGAMDAARQMLSQLQKALDQIRRGLAMAPQQQQQLSEAKRLMEGLRELTQRQQTLMDETFQRAQQDRLSRRDRQGPEGAMPPQVEGREGAPRPGEGERQGQDRGQSGQGGQQGEGRRQARPGDPNAMGRARQEALRRALGELMLQMDEMLGNIPGEMGQAERAMREASRALGQGQPGDAVPPQSEALEHLQKSQDQMSQQMAQQFGPQLGLRLGPQGQRRNDRGQDPFGRGAGGAFGSAIDGDVDVPTRMEMRRAREILEELRKRSGEPQRPPLERDYIDRLLKQF